MTYQANDIQQREHTATIAGATNTNTNTAATTTPTTTADNSTYPDSDTISDFPEFTTQDRPSLEQTRKLSEMSIECSTPTDPDMPLDNEVANRIVMENKVKAVFELPESERLINEFPCYMIRLVTLPGWMYITNNHVCFYAALPGKKKGPHKAGYLSKKNHVTSPRTYRYYFELCNHVLSWYTSAETKYSPLNSIDLKCVVKIEPSSTKKYGIRLTTDTHHHYTIMADSDVSQREWLDELRKGVFIAQHAGNSVRVVLPFAKISTVDKPLIFQFADNIRIRFQEDMSDSILGEDYYFAFFPDVEYAYNEIIEAWRANSSSDGQSRVAIKAPPRSNKESNAANNSFLSFDSFMENISPGALPTLLLGKLANVTSMFQQPQPQPQSQQQQKEDKVDQADQNTQPQSSSSLLSSVRIPYMSRKRNDSDTMLTTSPSEMSTASLASRLKRNSLFFNNKTSSSDKDIDQQSAPADLTAAPVVQSPASATIASGDSKDYFRGTEPPTEETEQVHPIIINRSRPLSGSYSLAKIPRAVTDAIKNQVLRSDTHSDITNTSVPVINEPAASSSASVDTASQQSTDTGRNRSKSLSNIRHHMSPSYLYSKFNSGSNSNNSNNQNASSTTLPITQITNTSMPSASVDISLASNDDSSSTATSEQQPMKNRKQRAKSIGSTLISGTWNKLTPGSPDYYFQQQHMNENQHRHPKGPIWLSDRMVQKLEQHAALGNDDSTSSDSSTESDEEELAMDSQVQKSTTDPKVREEEQKTMNEHLNANFPMLLRSEEAEAVFKSYFWRTIPYSGKIYITEHYFCFSSKVLAGQQKLMVPWQDIIQVNKYKTKSYYMLHGLTMIVKDIPDQIYFDFSTDELRDHCYSICDLKTQSKISHDGSSIISGDSMSMSSMIMDRPEHVIPPNGYDGPPLLSSSAVLSKPSEKYKRPQKSLHFTCLTIGSRGDVQPYVALCKELQKDGHRCRIATHPEYEDWIKQHGIEFRSVGGDPGELMKLCIDNSFLSVSFIREGTKFFYSWFENLLQASYEACKGTDVIIESPSAMVGVHMAEKLGIAYFRSMPFPFTRTAKFPHPFASHTTAGGRIYNDMTYVMIDMALWAGTAKYVNRFRRQVLELPPTNLERLELWRVPYIYSFSPTVVHPPKDWPDFIHCTGYWFLDNPDMKWKPDGSFVEFLNNKEDKRPIVYIGFGSIIVPDAVETTRQIVQAVLKADVRAIICKGWSARITNTSSKISHKKSRSMGELEDLKQEEAEQDEDSENMLDRYPGTIYQIESVPHDWLFPQIQGVVHHGGAGTTAAGLRAGLPTVIKPFFGDQRFWGQRVEELQVGICLSKLNKNHLCDALKTITQNTTMIAKARKVGETIRKENGPRNAVECIYRELDYAKEQRVSGDTTGNNLLADSDNGL